MIGRWGCSVLVLAAVPAAQERLRVSVACAPTAFVGEGVGVDVVLAFDGPWFAEHGIVWTRQPLDLPVHVQVPWLHRDDDRSALLVPPSAGEATLRLAVGDRVVSAVLLPERTAFGLLQARLRTRVVAHRPGELELGKVEARYAYASAFRDHLLRGREPVDRREVRVAGDGPERIAVQPLPSPAPDGFFGAVGAFTVAAACDREEVCVGEVFRIELTLRGDGDLSRCAPLPPPNLPGCHVEGIVERAIDGGRVYELDVLALRAGGEHLPPLSVVTFAPAERAYVQCVSAPVPLRVLPMPADAEPSERVRELIAAAEERSGTPRWLYRIGFGVLALVGVLLFRRGQGGRRRRRLQTALQELHTAVDGGDPGATAGAFERTLAAVADCEGFVVPLVWDGLRDRGVAVDDVLALQALHARLDAARFGGEPPARDEVLAAVGKALPE